MIRVLSIILIVMSTSLYGQYKANKLINYQKKAEEIKKFFTLVESNINFNRKPISEILYEIKKNKLFQNLHFLDLVYKDIKDGKPFNKSFVERVSEEKDSLTYTTVNILNDFANLFGKSNADGESNNLRFLDKLINNEIEEIKENKNKNTKVYISIGFFSGIAISLFII